MIDLIVSLNIMTALFRSAIVSGDVKTIVLKAKSEGSPCHQLGCLLRSLGPEFVDLHLHCINSAHCLPFEFYCSNHQTFRQVPFLGCWIPILHPLYLAVLFVCWLP
jgi:hypothetical protein